MIEQSKEVFLTNNPVTILLFIVFVAVVLLYSSLNKSLKSRSHNQDKMVDLYEKNIDIYSDLKIQLAENTNKNNSIYDKLEEHDKTLRRVERGLKKWMTKRN